MYHNPTTPSNFIQKGTAMSSNSDSKLCKYCGNHIVFDDNIVSKNGKRKPLNEWNHQVHDCKFSPYNTNKARQFAEEKALEKLHEWEIIDNLKIKVAATNNRLSYHELRLDVMDKEDI